MKTAMRLAPRPFFFAPLQPGIYCRRRVLRLEAAAGRKRRGDELLDQSDYAL